MNYLFLLALTFQLVISGKSLYVNNQINQSPTKNHVINGQQMFWFNQVLDHYDYGSVKYFKQRYWVVKDYFNPKIGPVLLYICGEQACKGVPQQRQWIITLAQKMQGLIIVLQHRFYGDSLPFGQESFSIANMKYLNTQQALRDLAYFIDQIKSNSLFGVNKNPWITVGGSYAGALSARFRYKYPHLVIGALASSAVILTDFQIKKFDEQIYISSSRSGNYCSNAINMSNYQVQAILSSKSGAQQFKAQFIRGSQLTNNQFLFFWADINALTIQYGGRTSICEQLKGKNEQQQFQTLITNAKNYQAYEYGSFWLKNQTMAFMTKSGVRPWYYQQCTEYGLFQTFSDIHPMRSKAMNLQFFKQFCEDAFGSSTWSKVEAKQILYGQEYEKATNIIFSNGIQDPWRWGSLQSSNNKDLVVRVIDCPNCGHCINLYTPDLKDADNLKKARELFLLTISEWVNNYWNEFNLEEIKINQR